MFAFTRPRFWALFFTEFRCHHGKAPIASARPEERRGTQKETQAPPEKHQHIA